MKRLFFISLLLSGLASALVLNNTSAITVTSAGTAVQVSLPSANVTCTGFTIQARSSNAGSIYIGNSTVSASNKYGIYITAGQGWGLLPVTTSIIYYKLSDFWIDATNSGDGVTWACVR